MRDTLIGGIHIFSFLVDLKFVVRKREVDVLYLYFYIAKINAYFSNEF